ncbi:hypothetical protein L3Q82_012826, partial [Scortum barcoo]
MSVVNNRYEQVRLPLFLALLGGASGAESSCSVHETWLDYVTANYGATWSVP